VCACAHEHTVCIFHLCMHRLEYSLYIFRCMYTFQAFYQFVSEFCVTLEKVICLLVLRAF